VWLDRVKQVYGENLEITWKNFSLEQINSKEDPSWKAWEQGEPAERRSLLSQMTAEAARRQGAELYEKFHLALLTARHGGDGRIPLNEESSLLRLAEEIGLDVGRLREDLKDPDLAKIIGKDHENAVGEGVFGTPTFVFENGTSAYLKTFIPPEYDSVAAFEGFLETAVIRS